MSFLSLAARPGMGFAVVVSLALPALPQVAVAAPAHHGHPQRGVWISFAGRVGRAAVSVRQGHAVNATILAAISKRAARSVSYGASRLPAGMTARFHPATVKPGVAPTLTLATSATARPGPHTIHVWAVGRLGASHTRRNVNIRIEVVRSLRRGLPGSRTAPAGGPTHIETWAYDDGCNGGTGASAALVRAWVTFAENNCGGGASKALSDCQSSGVTYCTTVQYVDANKNYNQGSVPIRSSARENWWLHQPGFSDPAHRIYVPPYGGGYLLNQANPGVDNWFKTYLDANNDSYAAIEMDDTSASLTQQLYPSGFATSNELTSDAAIVAEHAQMAASLTHSDGSPFLQIDNGISDNPYLPTSLALLNNPSTVTGMIAEGVPEDNGVMPASSWEYTTLLDEMAYIDHTARDFMVLLPYDASGSLQARRVQAGTVLLGYSPGHIVSWSDLETSSTDLSIWPEEGIVPTDPVQSMGQPGGAGCFGGTGVVCSTRGHRDLQVAPGVYRREFGACYNRGRPFGGCAAVVNTTASPVTVRSSWLTHAYTYEIAMRGGDVQSGGTINLAGVSFTAGRTTIPAYDAVLLSS